MADKAREGAAGGARAFAGPQSASGGGKAITAADPAREGGPGTAAALGFVSVQLAAGAAQPPPSFPMTPSGFMALQRLVGNRAVAAAMERVVQRVPVSVTFSETLYTGEGAGGKAAGGSFGQGGQFQMTRDADNAVNIDMKIKFVRQHRNTINKRPGHPSDPDVGDLTGPITELPEGDRAWATTTSAAAVAHWNGRLVLVGKDKPRPDAAEVDKRLKVVFKATPTFGKNDVADQTVVVHPPNVTGGSKGNPIDSGDFYMKKNDKIYPDSDDQIYAHEYGHLLGIPDEYSQSNEQINQLLHRASPADAASSMAALDKKTIELMVLATLTRPLFGQLQSSMGAVTSAIKAQKKAVKTKMTSAAHDAVRTPEIADLLTNRLTTMSSAKVKPHVPKAVALQTTKNFAHAAVATDGVERILAAGSIGKMVGDTYWKALTSPQDEVVNVPGLGETKVEVQESIYGAAAKRGALRNAAVGEAAGSVGKTGPGLPKIPPPDTLVGQLAGAAGAWSAAGGAIETAITSAAFQAKMLATLNAATIAAGVLPLLGFEVAPTIKSDKALYGKAWTLVNNAAREAVKQLATEMVGATLNPVLQSSVASLRTAIGAEVTRIMTSPPGALAASPPDPNMAKLVADMKGRLDAAKTALAGTGMDPLGVTGATTPAQDVTYSYQGMMGAGKTEALRADQFKGLIDKFNTTLKLATEQNFTPEMK